MPLTDRIDTVGKFIFDLISDNQAPLGLEAVYYGDQAKVPVTPIVCVDTGPKNRVLAGVPRVTEVTFEVYVLVYLEKIQSIQVNRSASESLGEDIEDLIHQNEDLGGLVIHSFCSSNEPGYFERGGFVRGSRITVSALSKVRLPSTA